MQNIIFKCNNDHSTAEIRAEEDILLGTEEGQGDGECVEAVFWLIKLILYVSWRFEF